MSPVFPGEKLPPLDKMPGHVLHGWRDDNRGKPHTEKLNLGHRSDSQRPGVSKFPIDWTDQKIVDAIWDVLEDSDVKSRVDGDCRIVDGVVDGVSVRVSYYESDRRMVFRTAFPIGGKGVEKNAG